MDVKFTIKSYQNLTESEKIKIHKFRYYLFVEYLGWNEGLKVLNNMEFDEYDDEYSSYLFGTDKMDQIVAVSRLRSLNYKCYIHELLDLSNEFQLNKFELSRYGVAKSLRIRDQLDLYSEMSAVLIKFGLLKGIRNYIACATSDILPTMRKKVKWQPEMISELENNGEKRHFLVSYEISQKSLDNVIVSNNIDRLKLDNFKIDLVFNLD